VNLYGLGANATLVLIDGRRQATFPFAQFGTESFVDLNFIPLTAVDRIEVLKDGASAIYGSDAVAGVVNILLKDEYQGADLKFYYGISQRGDYEVYHVSAVSGFGEKLGENSKFSVLATFDYYEQSPVTAQDRSYRSNAQTRRSTQQRDTILVRRKQNYFRHKQHLRYASSVCRYLLRLRPANRESDRSILLLRVGEKVLRETATANGHVMSGTASSPLCS
jgi:outer membrane receptor protein involved in Fe transport